MFGIGRLFRRATPSIRLMQTADSSAAAHLHAKSFARGWSEEEMGTLVLDRQVEANAMVRGARLDGFVLSRLAADEAEILTIAVDPAQRGAGLGRMLLSNHLTRLAARGVKALYLEVEESNVAALALYRRVGFVEVGRRPAYYAKADGTRSEALVLKRDLA
jgi:ribosomal-protein-alanine N-acetyltransferase